MSSPGLWTVLGIEPTRDVSLIRKAYAAALKLQVQSSDRKRIRAKMAF